MNNDDIDWSGFDINNYPKVNYYYVLFRLQHGYLLGRIHGTFVDDLEVILISVIFIVMGIVSLFIKYNFLAVVFFVVAVIMMISIPFVHYYGKKFYLNTCKEMYKDDYYKKVENEKNSSFKQNLIDNFVKINRIEKSNNNPNIQKLMLRKSVFIHFQKHLD